MPILRDLTAVWFLVLPSLLVLSASSRGDDGTTQLIADKIAIGEVVAQYSYTWDGKNADGFAELFTEDAILEGWLLGKPEPLFKHEGRQKILAVAKNSYATRLADRQTRHNQSALIFHEVSGTSARTQNMVLITHQTAEDVAPVPKFSGIYQDEWKKTEDGWKLTKRSLVIDSMKR